MYLSRKRKTLLVTATFFLLSFMLMLNIMVNLLQSNAIQQEQNVLRPDFLMTGEMEFNQNYFIAKSQRQPKAAIERLHSESDSGQKLIVEEIPTHRKQKQNYLNLQKHLRDTVLWNSQNQERLNIVPNSKVNNIGNIHISNDNGDESDDYDYDEEEEDIEKVVIEEEEGDEDDSEYDDEELNDKNIVIKQKPQIHLAKPVKGDHNTFTKPPLQYKEIPDKKSYGQGRLKDNNGATIKITNIIEDGIYWSPTIENLVPKGDTFHDTLDYISSVRVQNVQSLQPPSWDRCGRPKNGFVTLEDGRHMCARYREPHNKMMLGEVLSFYLSRLLGLDNVPAVVLAVTNHTSPRWSTTDYSTVDWKDGKIVALIQWIPNMDSYSSLVKMPQIILNNYEQKSVINQESLENSNLTTSQLSQLFQWGGMILFDYLTGNYDRIASMQDAAYKEKKPSIIAENIRNLRKSIKTSKLWLIDNESGLLDAYDLMYQNGYGGDKFIKFHRDMLQTFCVFPKSIVQSLLRLNSMSNPEEALLEFASKYEPLLGFFPKDSVFRVFQKRFKERVSEVSDWVNNCRSKLSRRYR